MKYVRGDFVILDPVSPPVHAYTLLAYTPSPLVRACGYYFSENVWQIYFMNYYQWKNHKQRYKIKKLLHKAIKKCQIKTPRRAMELRVRFWIDDFGSLNRSLSLFYYHFVRNQQKKIMAYVRLQLNLTHISQFAFSCTTPPTISSYVLYGWPAVKDGF